MQPGGGGCMRAYVCVRVCACVRVRVGVCAHPAMRVTGALLGRADHAQLHGQSLRIEIRPGAVGAAARAGWVGFGFHSSAYCAPQRNNDAGGARQVCKWGGCASVPQRPHRGRAALVRGGCCKRGVVAAAGVCGECHNWGVVGAGIASKRQAAG